MKRLILFFLSVVSPSILFSQSDGYHDLYPIDTIYFESNTIPYQILPNSGNCWQVGHPSKSLFNQAYSEPLAIVTDTLNPYPVNSNSSFTFVIPQVLVQSTFTTYFQFYHKYDTDTIQDYGTIEASYNGGTSWEILKDSTCNNFYDCIHLFWDSDYVFNTARNQVHSLNTTGSSNGWVRSRFLWWWSMPVDKGLPFQPDSIMIRFTFHSDGNPSTREGWMIDNILIGFRDEGSGINEKENQEIIRITPQPLHERSTVYCRIPGKTYEFSVFDLTGKILFQNAVRSDHPLVLERSMFVSGLYLWKCTVAGHVEQAGKLVVK
jgi:hypothetical protein